VRNKDRRSVARWLRSLSCEKPLDAVSYVVARTIAGPGKCSCRPYRRDQLAVDDRRVALPKHTLSRPPPPTPLHSLLPPLVVATAASAAAAATAAAAHVKAVRGGSGGGRKCEREETTAAVSRAIERGRLTVPGRGDGAMELGEQRR
jgi:hypothetical protein